MSRSNLNLRKSIVTEFWRNRDPRMGVVLQWMETMEDWGMDDNKEFTQALLELVPILENSSRESVLNKLEPMLQVMAYMSSSRALRLMEWFDEHFHQGLSLNLIGHARSESNKPHSQLMLDRLRALQSLSLLGQVFSVARTRLIVDLLRETSDSKDPIEGRGRF